MIKFITLLIAINNNIPEEKMYDYFVIKFTLQKTMDMMMVQKIVQLFADY